MTTQTTDRFLFEAPVARKATRAFQRDDAASMLSEVVPPAAPLRLGARGAAVIELQRLLNIHGADLVEDGFWGTLTQRSILEFQRSHNLAPNGLFDPPTRAALERRLPLGDFGVVFPQFTDDQLAFLLQTMARNAPGTWNKDTAEFALAQMNSGDLLGIVYADTVDKIRLKRVSATRRGQIPPKEQLRTRVTGAEHIPVADNGKYRGLVVVANGLPQRDSRFATLVMAHELNHFRNRVRADFELVKTPISAADYVDPALATATNRRRGTATGVQNTRKSFILELAARHAAWHVDAEIAAGAVPPAPTTMPAHLQFFKAAVGFATAFAAYNDIGYMQSLLAASPARFREQVVLWMAQLPTMDYHGDPQVNAFVRQWFADEVTQARQSGFQDPGGQGDGLA